ncbi:hypothetical protein CPLU01_04452 [Colletotrichum plurivorum]|uniref:Uncharacterized protein n=1 Tax=Colletotrichum plurivorum TaxID=2175906 RepID=A0A8H6KPB0_9PEZI|nr:hypothetical protein CPLU01_04452 [Colletotrichum plurivorum]
MVSKHPYMVCKNRRADGRTWTSDCINNRNAGLDVRVVAVCLVNPSRSTAGTSACHSRRVGLQRTTALLPRTGRTTSDDDEDEATSTNAPLHISPVQGPCRRRLCGGSSRIREAKQPVVHASLYYHSMYRSPSLPPPPNYQGCAVPICTDPTNPSSRPFHSNLFRPPQRTVTSRHGWQMRPTPLPILAAYPVPSFFIAAFDMRPRPNADRPSMPAMPCHAMPCRATTHGSRSTAHARRGGKGLHYHLLPGSSEVKVPGPEPFDSHYRRDASHGGARRTAIKRQVLYHRAYGCTVLAAAPSLQAQFAPIPSTRDSAISTKFSDCAANISNAPYAAWRPRDQWPWNLTSATHPEKLRTGSMTAGHMRGATPEEAPRRAGVSLARERHVAGGVLDGSLILAKGELAEDRLGTDDSGLPSVPMQAALSKNRKRLPSEKCWVQNAYQEVVLNILKLRAWREVASMAVES